MAITQVYVNPAIAGNSGTGTIGDPYGDLQYALNTQARDATNGNQFNVKAGTAEVLAASLTLATYGTPTAVAPLVIRGYTAAANDGGIGEINCNGATMWAATSYDCVMLVDLKIYASINVSLILLRSNCTVFRCEAYITGGASDIVIQLSGVEGTVAGCYVHGTNAGGTGIYVINDSTVIGNYVDMGLNGLGNGITAAGSYCVVAGNIVLANSTTARGIVQGNFSWRQYITGNILYNLAAGTSNAIFLGDAANEYGHVITNNIICGWSGVGGTTVKGVCNVIMMGYNAFWNNANPYSISDKILVDLTANDVALSADPFTNAAAGDFSLTAAGKTALRGLGWPAAYLGAHANTDGHVTIGPIQYGEAVAASGGLLRHPGMTGGIDG